MTIVTGTGGTPVSAGFVVAGSGLNAAFSSVVRWNSKSPSPSSRPVPTLVDSWDASVNSLYISESLERYE